MINDETRFAQLAGAATLSQVTGTKVVTESGQLLGTIAQLDIDDDARSVTSYMLSAPFVERVMRHQEEVVQAGEVVRLGDGGIMIVADAVGGAASSLKFKRGSPLLRSGQVRGRAGTTPNAFISLGEWGNYATRHNRFPCNRVGCEVTTPR